MTDPQSVLCPECGWTEEIPIIESADDVQHCPICEEAIEFVD